MSLLRKVFKSKKRKQEACSSESAIEKLREMEELLVKKQLHYEQKIEHETNVARRQGKNNKTTALAALRRKKNYEHELTNIDNALMKLENQRTALENAGSHVEIMTVLSDTTKVLRTANAKMDIDKVDDIMDDIRESLQDANEVSLALSQSPFGDRFEEDELMKELLEMEDDLTPTIVLPTVPTRRITRSMSKDAAKKDDEMRELEKWAAAN